MRRQAHPLVRVGGSLIIMAALLLAGGAAAAPNAPTVTLYDQTSTGNKQQDWVASSNFEELLDNVDSQGADDFVVPTTQIWYVSTVVAHGHYDGGGSSLVDSVLVEIYANSLGDLPGRLIRSETIPGGQISGRDTGVFVMNLATPLTLGPGHYWFSVQANKTFSGNNRQWGWHESTELFYSPSVWRQPGDAYATGCTTFQVRLATCHQPALSSNPDLLFRIEGTSATVAGQVFLPSLYR